MRYYYIYAENLKIFEKENRRTKVETLKINDIQKSYYKKMEEERFDVYFKLYNQISKDIRAKKQISILDVGGGSGVFAKFIEKQQGGGKNSCN